MLFLSTFFLRDAAAATGGGGGAGRGSSAVPGRGIMSRSPLAAATPSLAPPPLPAASPSPLVRALSLIIEPAAVAAARLFIRRERMLLGGGGGSSLKLTDFSKLTLFLPPAYSSRKWRHLANVAFCNFIKFMFKTNLLVERFLDHARQLTAPKSVILY